jgi:hypothetical protein
MATARRSISALTPRVRLLIGAGALLALLLVIALIARGETEDDTVRTIVTEEVPEEIPAGIVPDGSEGILGQVATRRGEVLSVAVDFTVLSTDRDALQAEIESAAEAGEWDLFERVYDDRQMRLLFLNDTNETLTVTMTIEVDRILAAAVIVRNQ